MKRRTRALLAAASLAVAVGVPVVAHAATPGLNGPITFVSGRDGNDEIYLMDADGANQRPIAPDPYGDSRPQISPNGTRVAWHSQRHGGSGDIFTANLNGTNVVDVTHNAAQDANAAWSPDGTKLAFQSDRAGGASQLDIWVVNADGTNPVRLTDAVNDDREPAWSPDGSRIAFVSHRDGQQELYVMDADGSDQKRLTTDNVNADDPDWSPDGTRIMWSASGDVVTMKPDGSDYQELTSSPAFDSNPAYSPDGTKVVFFSNRDDYYGEIYTMDADGSDVRRLTTNTKRDVDPRWGILNQPPVCQDFSEDVAGPKPVVLTLSCADPEGAAVTFAIASPPAHGTLGPVQPDGTVVYTPQRGYAGPDAFAFTATDGAATSAPATGTLAVTDANRAPTCVDVSAETRTPGSVDVTLSCSDPDGDPVTRVIVSYPGGGTLGLVTADGRVRYSPKAGFTGKDAFTFAASDGLRQSPAATATITTAATVLTTPPVVVAPGPRDAVIQKGPNGSFRIQVIYSVRTACGGRTCKATADIRTRGGRRLYASASRLPGDGPVLGRRAGLKLPAGQKVRFWLTVSKQQLLRTPFHTVGANRVAETRLRVLVRTPRGTVETVRDGHIVVSIARIRSGALPGLRGIL